MLAALLHSIWQYQVFKSVVFRGGMAFLTAYLLILWVMPKVIRAFRKKGLHQTLLQLLLKQSPTQEHLP